MTYSGLIELLERLRANAEEHGRHRDVIEIGEAVKTVTAMFEDLTDLLHGAKVGTTRALE